MRTQFISLAVVTVLLCPPAPAQWVRTNGPYGGCVCALAVSGTNLFAGTNNGWANGGLFLSTNNGASWIEVMNGLAWEEGGINAIAISSGAAGDTNIFVGGGPGVGGGVCRSTNNGTSWTEANSGLTGTWVTSFAVNGRNLFTGLYYGGVFLSTNNGTSWTAVNGGLPKGQCISALAVSGQNLIAGADAGGGAYLSTNSGASWTQTGLTSTSVWSFAVSGTNLFAGTYDGVFLSTNNGISWTAANTPFSSFGSMVQIGSNLFAATGGGVFLSTDNGTSWTSVGLTNKTISALAVSPNGMGGMNLFAGARAGGGVFLSTNNGTTWTEVNSGLTNIYAGSLASSLDGGGGTSFFASIMGNGVFLSTNNGTTWTAANTPFSSFSSMTQIGSNLFAGTTGGVFLSTNNGTSWTAANSGLTETDVSALAVSPDGTNIFAGTQPGTVFRSTNNGTSWTSTGLGGRGWGGLALAISPNGAGGTNLFAGAVEQIFLSTNNGANWTEVDWGLKGAVNAIVISGTNIFAGTGCGLFLSTNNGTSWTAVTEGLPKATDDTTCYTSISCLASSGQNIFAGTSGNGVFLSTNNGIAWSAVNSGLTNVRVRSLAVSGTSLVAGTDGRGIWRRPLSEMITGVERASEIPAHFVLEQNYPNPFNPSTTIRYELPRTSNVTLRVYDILAREVSLLVNERRDAGVHEVKFDGSGLASGIYFYRLQAGTYVDTKKLLLLR